VRTESRHWTENLTGLAGCGAQVALALVRGRPRPGHPLVPLVQVAESGGQGALAAGDLDGSLSGNLEADRARLLELVLAVAGGNRLPVAAAAGLVEFQLTRGLLGIST
jgi:hypothetical protein